MEKKTDRRILRTIRMLDDAMMELLEKKPVSEIGVTELCQQADINRNTFYCHYNTPQDVLRHLEARMMERIGDAISSVSNSVEASEAVLVALSSDKRLAGVLLSENAGNHFSSRLFSLAEKCALNIMQRESSKLCSNYQAMLSDFTVAGGAAIVKRWAKTGMEEPPEDVAMFIRTVCNLGSQEMQNNPEQRFQ